MEKVSDDEEEHRTLRERNGKFIMEQDMVSLTKSPQRRSVEQANWLGLRKDEPIVVTEVGESSSNGEVEFGLDPRLPETDKKMGPVEDTLLILVDEIHSSKVLQIGLKLSPTLRASLI